MHPIGAEAVEEIEVVHRQIADVADPRRIVRGAEARMLRDDHLELLARACRTSAARPAGRWRHAGTASGGPEPRRIIRTVMSRTLCLVPLSGMALALPRRAKQSTILRCSCNPMGTRMASRRYRTIPPPPLRRAPGAARRMRDPRQADRPRSTWRRCSTAIRAPPGSRRSGPEKAELIGNVMGSRKRLALALDTDEAGLLPEIAKRLANPVKPVKVAAARRAGAAGGAERRGSRSLRAARASAARRGRRALYLRRPRRHAVSATPATPTSAAAASCCAARARPAST